MIPTCRRSRPRRPSSSWASELPPRPRRRTALALRVETLEPRNLLSGSGSLGTAVLNTTPGVAGISLTSDSGPIDLGGGLKAAWGASDGPAAVNAAIDSSPMEIRVDFNGRWTPRPSSRARRCNWSRTLMARSAIVTTAPSPLSDVSYSASTNELQITPEFPLAPGHYQVLLWGDANAWDDVLAGPDSRPLGMDDGHPSGQDYWVDFQVDAPAGSPMLAPMQLTDQEPNDDPARPQDLGILAPQQLWAGISLTRDSNLDPASALADAADVYRFTVLEGLPFCFSLSGEELGSGLICRCSMPVEVRSRSPPPKGASSWWARSIQGPTWSRSRDGRQSRRAVGYHLGMTIYGPGGASMPQGSGPSAAIGTHLAGRRSRASMPRFRCSSSARERAHRPSRAGLRVLPPRRGAPCSP